ncbi:GH3 auxin-responsive promoter [Boletus coccyginus]|nr:GH3 auxin-responsive promoter [Boletus coccyginus]
MHPSDLLLSNPSSLSEQLRWRTDKLQSSIVRANCNTQFAQTAPELTEFRHATAGLVDGMDDDSLSHSFRKTVQFTTYESYAPLLARFFEKPCKPSAVLDLLAPGLPDYLCLSSSTSGGLMKAIPKYNCLSTIRSSDAGSWAIPDPLRRRTTAQIWSLGRRQIDIGDEDNVYTIYQASGTAITARTDFCLDPEKDDERMAIFIPDHAAPYATAFIPNWRSFLLIHALFAVGSRSLETMSMGFINTLVDMIRHLDSEFDVVVNCIANGTIPDLDGVAEVRHYLELNISPDPERAVELRRLGRPSSRPGWCGHVWPNLRSVTAISSGSFASSVPLAKWFLGPNTDICAYGYGSTEAWIGLPYNPRLELNQYKPSSKTVIEFLDIGQSDSISAVAQLWEVEVGRRYELVVTTSDGLWRYRLGDVVEISGFDPTDGVPIFQFVERRNVIMRFPDFMVTEKELREAMSSVGPGIMVNVVGWTAMTDDRRVPSTIGFFVELADDQVPDLALAPERVLEWLSRSNDNIAWALGRHSFGNPTIRLVRPGTFSDFRQLKLDEGSINVGQVKVPVVLPKPAYVTWFSNRVVQEL